MFKNSSLGILKKYFTQRKYLVLLVSAFLSTIILNLFNLVVPKISSGVINEYQSTFNISTKYYIYLGILLLVTPIFSFLQSYFFSILSEKIAVDLRNRLVKKVLKQDYNYLVRTKPSKILTTVLSDVNNVKGSFIQAFSTIITSLILVTGSVILMYSLNGKIATFIILTVPAVILLLLLILSKRFYLFKEIQKARDSLNKVINENIKASMLIRVFVSENTEIRKFKKTNIRYKILGIGITKIFAIAIPSINLVSLLCTLIIIQVGGQEAIAGNMQIGNISAFNLYVLLFVMPLLALAFMVTVLGQAFASLRRIRHILKNPDTFVNGTTHIREIESIQAKNLTFTDKKFSFLQDINFDLKKGQKIGIIGLTGSGKSLFLNHIIRANDLTSGELLINGLDIKSYKIEELRELIGFCFQENFLTNETIENNIKFGREITEEIMAKVCRIADVDEFVQNMKKGYQTLAGERGSNLSGGQKQRIMIARALAGNPSILILDDVTSRLDATTESKIIGNIREAYPDMSVIIVSQKISSLKECDYIYIFDEGMIKESGKHEELLKLSPLYKEIELMQNNHDES